MSRHESKHLSSDRVLDRKSPPRGTRHSPMGRCSSSEKKSPHKKDTTHRKKGPSLDKESELLVHGPICIDPAELKAIKVDIHRNISPAQQPPPPLQLDIGDPEQLTLYRKKDFSEYVPSGYIYVDSDGHSYGYYYYSVTSSADPESYCSYDNYDAYEEASGNEG